MKYLSTILICILLLIGGCNSSGGGGGDADESIPGAGAEDYPNRDYASEFMMWESYETPFADADKMGVGDFKMCWAAVAANLLAWTGRAPARSPRASLRPPTWPRTTARSATLARRWGHGQLDGRGRRGFAGIGGGVGQKS